MFDPFLGLGTTVFVAEELNRVPYGIEYDQQRFEWVAGQLQHWTNIRHADSARLNRLGLPKMDLCLTSPPFIRKSDKWNPLFAGDPAKAGYDLYLKQMGRIFAQVAQLMKKRARVVVQVDHLPGRITTPLVHDFARVISPHLIFEQETIVAYRGGDPAYRHTHCLVFRA